jgi:hypothetical protein
VTRQEWLDAFAAWDREHPTRELVLADPSWQEIFRGWCQACQTRAELDEHKSRFVNWAKARFSAGTKADPARGIAAVPADPGAEDMQKIFTHRTKQVA